MSPTPANLRYAHRIAGEIKDRIRHRAFVYADYFPASAAATTGQGVTLGQRLDLWLSVQTDKAGATLKGYRVAVEFWKSTLGHKPIRSVVHSDILAALSTKPE